MIINLPQFTNWKWKKVRLGGEKIDRGWLVVLDMQDDKGKWIVKSIILDNDKI